MDVFRKGKFELLALTEAKLKGNGEASGYEVNSIIPSVQERERIWKSGAVLLNNIWHSVDIDFGYVTPRMLWIKFKF